MPSTPSNRSVRPMSDRRFPRRSRILVTTARKIPNPADFFAALGLLIVLAPMMFTAFHNNSAAVAATAVPSIGGCAVFPADNAWNQTIEALAIHPESRTWMASVDAGSMRLHADFGSDPQVGIPFVVVPTRQVGVRVRFDEAADESDAGRYPIPARAPIESGSDRHVLVVQSGTCKLFELFGARRASAGWVAGSGAIFDLRSNKMRPKGWTSADAAGLPILPGLVRYDEVRVGAIRHPIRVTFPATQNGFVAPARHQAGVDDPSLPPMGARIRLRANVELSSYTGQARIILEAMKTYGLIVSDNGSSWFISGAPDSRWNDDDLRQLKRMDTSMFEFVDSGPIER